MSFDVENGLPLSISIILISGHRVLTFRSRFEYKSGRHGACFAVYCGRFDEGWCTSSIFILSAGKGISLRLVFLLSSEDPGPWDARDHVTVEPSPCPSKFQELAEPEKLETDVVVCVEVTSGHPRPSSVEAPVYRGCPP